MQSTAAVAYAFMAKHPIDAARILERLDPQDASRFLEGSPTDTVSGIVKALDPSSAARCLETMAPQKSAAVLAELDLDLSSSLLRRIEESPQKAIVAALPPELSAALTVLLRYPEGSAGAIMDPGILTLTQDITAGEAMDRVRRFTRRVRYYLYVVDRDNLLVGVLSVRDLMLAEPDQPIALIMRTNVARLSADAQGEAIISHPGWRSYHGLPVVDGREIVGIVFVSDVFHHLLRKFIDAPDR